MGAFKDIYDTIKELLNIAKAAQNQEVVQLAMDLQENFFELRENNEKILAENKELKAKLEDLEKAVLKEESIEYSERGFFTLRGEKRIPYCSFCWKKEHKAFPLAQYGAVYQYQCANCKSKVTVMYDDENYSNIKVLQL